MAVNLKLFTTYVLLIELRDSLFICFYKIIILFFDPSIYHKNLFKIQLPRQVGYLDSKITTPQGRRDEHVDAGMLENRQK